MEALRRAALIVRPRRRYKEWADSVAASDEDLVFDLDGARTTPMVYLVDVEDGASVEDCIDEYFAEIFEAELEAWSTDEASWPVNRSAHVFRDWFEVTFADSVVDLDPEAPLYFDEDLEGEDGEGTPDLIAALRGDPGATMACGWCDEPIEPDDPVVTVKLKGLRTPHAEPELMEVTVGGRSLQGVNPGDDSDAARAGVLVFFLFCSDDCANGFREAWERERGALSS